MEARMEVTPSTGCYLVAAAGHSERLRPHRVSKEKACSCGGTAARPCHHIRAVAEYLRRGGRRAAPLTEVCTCPVCGAEVERGAPHLNRLTGRDLALRAEGRQGLELLIHRGARIHAQVRSGLLVDGVDRKSPG